MNSSYFKLIYCCYVGEFSETHLQSLTSTFTSIDGKSRCETLIYQNGGLLRTSFLCQNYSNCEDLAQYIYRNNLCISANESKVYIYGAEGN